MNRVEAVIFDMDGVLIDSEPLWEETEKILLRSRGIEYNPEYRSSILGLNQHDSAFLLKSRFGLVESIDKIITSRIKILLSLYEDKLDLKPGIMDLLWHLNSGSITIGLASSSPSNVINYVLDKFGIDLYFNTTVSGDCIEKGKPNPDIYILAAQNMKVKTSVCIAIEDSVNGVKSAKNAGMYCIAVPDSRIDISEFQEADEIVADTSSLLNNLTIKSLFN